MSRNRLLLAVTMIVVIVLALLFLLLRGDDGDDDDETGSDTTSTSTTTASTSTTSSTTTSSSTTAPSTTTTTAPTTTTMAPSPLAAPVATAQSGGGSGEVALEWQAVPGAGGYRIGRAAGPGGPFEVVAEIDVMDGTVTAAADVINLFSDQHTYVPAGSTLTTPDASPSFQLIDVGDSERCFQVRAFDASGDGPSSPAACASPP